MPNPTFLVRRARLETFAWIGKWFGFNIAGDFASGQPAAANPVAQSWIATTDDYVLIAPCENVAMLQVGQFDAPFTLENRTSDKYFDFMERSITVRSFAIPSNKEVGSMLHGLLPGSIAYYSVGLFNGDGQNFANADANLDVMGRVWVAPAAIAQVKSIENAEIGGSFWIGRRVGSRSASRAGNRPRARPRPSSSCISTASYARSRSRSTSPCCIATACASSTCTSGRSSDSTT
jgi:phosphate-selective porin